MIKKKYFILFLWLGACSTSVESDHANQKHTIRCLGKTVSCYEKASELCPDGYLVTNRVRPRQMGDDVQFTLKVKCRSRSFFGMHTQNLSAQ